MVPVPPLLAVTLGVLGAAFVVKRFANEWRRPDADLDPAKAAPAAESQNHMIPKLRRDPQTGIYRP